MELLHGTWVPTVGKICVWSEKNAVMSTPALSKTKVTVTLLLPTYQKRQLLSPTMANHLDVAYPDVENVTFEPYEQSCLALTAFELKNLELTENMRIATDLLFWRNMVEHLESILDKNLYIPAISENKEPVWLSFYPSTQELAQFMPEMCCLSNGFSYKKELLLHHFFDTSITDIIRKIHISAATEKQIEDTFLQKYFQKTKPHFSAEEINDWTVWKSALDMQKHALCFQLEAPDHAQHTWSLQCFIQNPTDRTRTEKVDWYNYIEELGLALRIFPEFEAAFDKDKLCSISLSTADAQTFLKETAWVLQSAGFPVIIPSWYTPKGQSLVKLKLKRKSATKSSSPEKGFFSREKVLQFNVGLSLNGQEITAEEWQQLLDQTEEIVQFRGQWVQLDLAQMEKILGFWREHPSEELDLLSFMERAAHPDIELDAETDAFMLSLYGKQNFELYDDPAGFNGQLRAYQKLGYSWLRYMEQLGLNPCLADDMGLGKTIQIIALMLSDQQNPEKNKQQKNLLIVPTSVLGNWEKEIAKFAPQLSVTMYHAQSKSLESAAFQNTDVLLTTFSMIRRALKGFKNIHWHRVIVDEAQNIKNPNAIQTKAIQSLKANHRLALTGTPIENSLMDLWSLFHFLNANYLGTSTQFKRNFHRVPENRGQLKRLVEPFILRRLKTDKNILGELPDKIEQKVYCQLTKEQAALYQNVVKQLEASLKNEEEAFTPINMLATLTRLKQICNHPAQFLQDNSDFSATRSLKLQRLEETIEEAILNEESVLIFSQYKEICIALHKALSKQYNTYLLHGDTSRTRRDQMITEFQDPQTPPSVFILSLKAGGVGITLTKASQVVHFDRWWNPAVESQATDRAFRIGQEKKVLVHKFVTLGTLEEKIHQMIESKKELSESVLSDDTSWLKELDVNTFMDVIKLRQEAFSDGE